MPFVHRAAWVLPIAARPIRNGWVAVENGRIAGVGGPEDSEVFDAQLKLRAPQSGIETGLPPIAILPGLVNAHTHLELSWMRGRVPPGDAMPAWAERLIALRQTAEQTVERGTSVPRRAPIVDAIREARASGTTLVGDVTNTLEAYEPLVESALSAAIFYELIGFRPADPDDVVREAQARVDSLMPDDRLRPSVVPHAPYSVSPDLFRSVGRTGGTQPLCVHLGESREEVTFLQDGSGPWRHLLERVGAWSPHWVPPACGPVEYLHRLGLLSDRLVAVHATHLTDAELRRLASAGATVVTCPRSNDWTGAGVPPIERFYASGVRVAVGTDSLASVDDLSLFNEMAAVRRIAPAVSARQILQSATLDGARALGFGNDLGSIEEGKRAALIAVRIPHDLEDVEEYLVNGIQPADVAWLESD
jgi:cytosine/adenosine deaminase-related metal-dependent hydrolase